MASEFPKRGTVGSRDRFYYDLAAAFENRRRRRRHISTRGGEQFEVASPTGSPADGLWAEAVVFRILSEHDTPVYWDAFRGAGKPQAPDFVLESGTAIDVKSSTSEKGVAIRLSQLAYYALTGAVDEVWVVWWEDSDLGKVGPGSRWRLDVISLKDLVKDDAETTFAAVRERFKDSKVGRKWKVSAAEAKLFPSLEAWNRSREPHWFANAKYARIRPDNP